MVAPLEPGTLSDVPYVPGPIADFNTFPLVGPGAVGPLMYHPAEASQTPEIMRLGVGRLVTFRRWGLPVGTLPLPLASEALWKWAKGPYQPWGLGRESAQLDDFEQYDAPAASSEVIHEFDVERCIDVDPGVLTPSGVAFELTRFDVPSASVGVLQYYPTVLEVDALDEQGAPVFTYSETNGERPCRSSLVHPDPLVAVPLTWAWRIVATTVPGVAIDVEALLGPVPTGSVPGSDVVQSWADLRNGNQQWWPDRRQHPVMPRTMLRYFVTLFGPTDRFAVRVGGRLGGYWQVAGRRGVAVSSATKRFV